MRILLLSALTLAFICFGPGMVMATDSGAVYGPGPGTGGTRATGDASLTTLFAQNNNFAGNSFDILPYTDVTVVGWDCNLAVPLPSVTIEIYTRAGTAQGHETSSAGWTMLGSLSGIVPQGIDVPTHVDIGGLPIAAGELIGVVIICPDAVAGTGGFHYSNMAAGTTFSNADMMITTFNGMGPPFPPSSVFTGRAWNGTVHYDYATSTAVEASTWGAIKAAF